MEANKEKKLNNNSREASWAGLAIFTIAGLFVIYLMLPSILLLLAKKESNAKIVKLDDENIVFEYYNNFDKNTYILAREINKNQYIKIRNKKELIVSYTILFPEEITIKDIDKNKSSYASLFVIIIIIYTSVKAAKDIFVKK